MIEISSTLSLPLDYVTQRGALLAVSGAGKSNAARVIAEGFYAQQLPFVTIDPKGDWWGLRAGKDGKPGGGLGVVIFGGEHADIPLERGGGVLVADTIVDQRLSSIVDLSLFETEADKKAFLLDFGKRLYHRNRDPLHIFAEECDEYLPQKPFKDELKLLRVFENIVRKGRTRGLGITLISQRSAVINKNVLTQAETLFALRSSGPQDIAAIEGWMKYHGGDRAMLATLAGLENGEAWVWSPHYLKRMERFQFKRSHTFDSGATPTNHKAGTKRKVATLADVDLAALRGAMAETIERVEAEDPKVLRRRITELEKLQAASEAAREGVGSEADRLAMEVEELQERVASLEAQNVALRMALDTAAQSHAVLGDITQRLRDNADRMVQSIETVRRGLEGVSAPAPTAPPLAPLPATMTVDAAVAGDWKGADPKARVTKRPMSVQPLVEPWHQPAFDTPRTPLRPAQRRRQAHEESAVARKAPGGTTGLDKPATAILGVLAAHGSLIPRARLALLAGYSATAGAFGNCLSRLRTAGWIQGSSELEITRAGRAVAPRVAPMPTGGALIEYWRQHPRMDTPMRAIFDALVSSVNPLTREQVAAKTGYSATAGAFGNALSRLRTLGIVHGKGKESLRLAPTLEEAAKVAA